MKAKIIFTVCIFLTIYSIAASFMLWGRVERAHAMSDELTDTYSDLSYAVFMIDRGDYSKARVSAISSMKRIRALGKESFNWEEGRLKKSIDAESQFEIKP